MCSPQQPPEIASVIAKDNFRQFCFYDCKIIMLLLDRGSCLSYYAQVQSLLTPLLRKSKNSSLLVHDEYLAS